MPPKEETGRTGVDEGNGDSTEVDVPVGHPGGMSKGHLGPEVSEIKLSAFFFHSFFE